MKTENNMNTITLLYEDGGPRVRRTDPLTSHAAADSNLNRAEVEAFVCVLFREIGPMSDDELTVSYFLRGGPDRHYDSPRKRRADAKNKGLIVATNILRLSKAGRKMTVWDLA